MTWDKEKQTLSIEASDLELKSLEKRATLDVQSHWTKKVVRFIRKRTARNDEGEILSWEFVAWINKHHVYLVIFND